MKIYTTHHRGAWRKPYNDPAREAAARADLARLATVASRYEVRDEIECETLALLGRWRQGFVSPVAMVELINDLLTLQGTEKAFELDDHKNAIWAARAECSGRQAHVRGIGYVTVRAVRAYIEPDNTPSDARRRLAARLAMASLAARHWTSPEWQRGSLDAVRLAGQASAYGEAIFYDTARDRLEAAATEAQRRRLAALTKHWRAVKVQATGASATFTLAAMPSEWQRSHLTTWVAP